VAAQCYDVRERTLRSGTDNLNTLFWSRSGSVTTTSPTATILCQQALHQRYHRYLGLKDYYPGDDNRMADDASRLHLRDRDFLTHFNSTYPQTQLWRLYQIHPKTISSAISALRTKTSPMASFLRKPRKPEQVENILRRTLRGSYHTKRRIPNSFPPSLRLAFPSRENQHHPATCSERHLGGCPTQRWPNALWHGGPGSTLRPAREIRISTKADACLLLKGGSTSGPRQADPHSNLMTHHGPSDPCQQSRRPSHRRHDLSCFLFPLASGRVHRYLLGHPAFPSQRCRVLSSILETYGSTSTREPPTNSSQQCVRRDHRSGPQWRPFFLSCQCRGAACP
jgi:hypothetical protein